MVSRESPPADELKNMARTIRGRVIEMSHRGKTAHLGGALSVVDILVAAYWGVLSLDPKDPSAPNRDRFIFSKGHAISAFYATLAYRGFFPTNLLDTFAVPGGSLPEHPSPSCVPGLEVATGSLGHGLSVGLGMSWAARLQGRRSRVFVVISDGEANEGSVWEAALLAPALKLGNLAVIVDYNKWQATGRSHEIMTMNPLKEKWQAFGWNAVDVDGHNVAALIDAMSRVPDPAGKPLAVVAHTVKGKGVSFMEDDNNWHYRIPTEEEVRKSKVELEL
ncbi:MAG: transketolase [Elusimicrobia bacterium]|jgi:transketolase|nr:transketolase [Elusimicrobiota bacterium]